MALLFSPPTTLRRYRSCRAWRDWRFVADMCGETARVQPREPASAACARPAVAGESAQRHTENCILSRIIIALVDSVHAMILANLSLNFTYNWSHKNFQ